MKVMKLAGCVIQNPAGKILLLHRNTPKRIEWELPGGKLEEDETFEAAAQREVNEELGVEVRIKRRIGGAQFSREDGEFYYEWFEAEVIDGMPEVQEPHMHDKLDYFSIAETDQLGLSGNLMQLKKSILDGTVKI